MIFLVSLQEMGLDKPAVLRLEFGSLHFGLGNLMADGSRGDNAANFLK
jgi:hypothetical protein